MTNFVIVDGLNTITFENISDAIGFEYPEIKSIFSETPGINGIFYINSKYGRRRLSWQGLVNSNILSNRRLITALTIGALKTLKFTTCDSLSLQAQIEIDRVNMPYKAGRSRYLIEAVAPDYRFYSQTLTSQDTPPTVSTGGVTLPTALPIDFSQTSGVPKLTLTNAGDEATPPIFTITGPGANFTIQNITTGEILQINTTITANESITIDVLNKTVLLNGQTNIFGLASGTFWEIPTGTSQLHFNAQSGSSSNTSLNVLYRSAYKGI